MAMVVTSYTPTTGVVTGGTLVTLTGTGVDVCTAVLVGGRQAPIVGTPTTTQVKFVIPGGAAAASVDVELVDTAAPAVVKAGVQFAYTASTTLARAETLAKKFALDVSANLAAAIDADFTRVMGIRSLKTVINPVTQGTGTYDSGVWTGSTKTALGWQNDLTVLRAIAADLTYDPGQTLLFNAHDVTGLAGRVAARWYDRNGGTEAFKGIADVTWSPQGGDNEQLDLVDIQLLGNGTRTKITNPVLANPALAL